jgi:hypothetical protein
MIVLEVPEFRKNDMNNLGIVICTYLRLSDNTEVDAISFDYKSQFIDFLEVEVII